MRNCREIQEQIILLGSELERFADRTQPHAETLLPIHDTELLMLIESLNAHHVVMVKALLELSGPSLSMSTDTVRQLSEMIAEARR